MIGTFQLGHVKVSRGSLNDFVEAIGKGIASGARQCSVPLNMSKYCMAKSDPKLAQALNMSDYVIADGKSIELLASRMGADNVERVTGIDLAETLLSQSRAKGWSVYLLGTKPENLAAAEAVMTERFDNPIIAGSRDGYFDPNDVEDVIAQINAVKPDILLLGLGLPQKEYFVVDHLEELDVRLTLTVGGAFDVWAGAKSRAPSWVQTLGIEWLYRSFYDRSRAGLIFRYCFIFAKDLIVPPK